MFLTNTISVLQSTVTDLAAHDTGVPDVIIGRGPRALAHLIALDQRISAKGSDAYERVEAFEDLLDAISAAKYDVGSSIQNVNFRRAFFLDYKTLVDQINPSTRVTAPELSKESF